MSGYRCVNFYELCRLCTASQGKKVHIFSEEGKQKALQTKISKGLMINIDENDKLPKILCTACVTQVETIYEYKSSCSQAQCLLESCLNSSKLRNGGQVYIKDGPSKPPLATITNVSTDVPPPTFTITATPKIQQVTPTVNVTPTSVSSDFLSSIIQGLGIQTSDENNETVTQHQPAMPQYTLTIDGQTLKASPVQYKLTETTPTFNIQHANIEDVDEFLKIKTTPKMPRKVQPLQPVTATFDLTTAGVASKKAKLELTKPTMQKPKINLVLSTPPKQQTQTIPVTIPTTSTTNKTMSLQQLFQATANKGQTVLPVVVKSEGSIEASNQFLSQIVAANEVVPTKQPHFNPPVAYVQLKIQPSPDGQPTVQLVPAQMPQTLQLSTQAIQNLNIQQQIQAQIQAQLAGQAQQIQIAPQTVQTSFSQAQLQSQPTISISAPQQTHIISQPTQQQVSVDTQVSQADIAMEENNMQEAEQATHVIQVEQAPKAQVASVIPAQPIRKQVMVKRIKQESVAHRNNPVSIQQRVQHQQPNNEIPPTVESIMAQQQMQQISALKHDGPNPPSNLTTCEVCKKIFKRKEHLMQHLKSHVGLRPFKCEESGCNKSFSRKEHLMRHIVSHTGKKMFSCDLCHKFFSRKDNLNKHRRTHPEVGGEIKIKVEKSPAEVGEVNPLVTKIKTKKQIKPVQIKSEPGIEEDSPRITFATSTASIPSAPVIQTPTYTPIKASEPQQITTSQSIQIQLPQTNNNVQVTSGSTTINQPQILQLPCIVSSSQNQIAYNQTTTQATKTTYIKAVTSTDGNTVYTIPSNLLIQQPNFITTNANGELQLGSFKIENSNS